MAANSDAGERPRPAPDLPPPRTETGLTGWIYANLFNSRHNAALTIIVGALALLGLWFGLRWIIFDADWSVIATIGGRFIIGNYNTDHACPGNNCFWRPQVSLLMVTALLGMGWGIAAGATAKRLALVTTGIIVLLAFLPYSLERMGWDVRLLLLANAPALALGWAAAKYTPLGSVRWIIILTVIGFLIHLLLMRGIPGIPGLQPVAVRDWGGLTLNLMLAAAGIGLSLPIGIALALGRRSRLPVVKLLCVIFIEVFRGVPLITLLFMSQVLVPLAFPEEFPAALGFLEEFIEDNLFRAAVVITLFSSAYMAENIRGGLQALHRGQAEAARALGLPGWQTTMLISLPQAIRNVIPAIVGQFIGLFKDTSLVYIISMLDVVEIGRTFIQGNTEYLAHAKELFIFLAVIFWIFTYGMSYISGRVEDHLGVGRR